MTVLKGVTCEKCQENYWQKCISVATMNSSANNSLDRAQGCYMWKVSRELLAEVYISSDKWIVLLIILLTVLKGVTREKCQENYWQKCISVATMNSSANNSLDRAQGCYTWKVSRELLAGVYINSDTVQFC